MNRRSITTWSDIRDRCVVSDETGCWIWRGSTAGRNGRPDMRFQGKVRRFSFVCHHLQGTHKQLEAKLVYHPTCSNRLCVAPDHQRLMSRSQINHMRIRHSEVTKAKISRIKRAEKRSRLTDHQRAEIRGSTMRLTEIMDIYGVSMGYASDLRSGKADIPRNRSRAGCGLQPGLAANASVFSMVSAA